MATRFRGQESTLVSTIAHNEHVVIPKDRVRSWKEGPHSRTQASSAHDIPTVN